MLDTSESGNGKLGFQVFVVGLRDKTVTLGVDRDATVDELFKLLQEKTGVPPDEARLIHAGKDLLQKKGKRISDYSAIVHGSTLFMVMRLHGGTEEIQQKILDDLAQLTDEPDMITWDDDPEGKRAKMPCGHAIGPESLTMFCRSLLSAGKFQFICPYVDPNNSTTRCNKEWTYIDVRRFAVLSEEEQKEFEKKISENYLRKAMGIQECPGCHSFCERLNKKDKRLICRVCTKDKGKRFEFCWNCLHEWQSSSLDKCGNEECSGEDPRLRILRSVSEKLVIGVKTPSCRACPTCGMLIEHLTACKHMVCRCGTEFCFICLKVKADGWSCGSFNTKCQPAARQVAVPGG